MACVPHRPDRWVTERWAGTTPHWLNLTLAGHALAVMAWVGWTSHRRGDSVVDHALLFSFPLTWLVLAIGAIAIAFVAVRVLIGLVFGDPPWEDLVEVALGVDVCLVPSAALVAASASARLGLTIMAEGLAPPHS